LPADVEVLVVGDRGDVGIQARGERGVIEAVVLAGGQRGVDTRGRLLADVGKNIAVAQRGAELGHHSLPRSRVERRGKGRGRSGGGR
jgi:hypothetical protein